MTVTGGRAVRRALGVGAIVLVAGCGLAACGGGSSGPSFNQTITGEHGSRSSVKFGEDAKIPNNFPTGVPLPVAGKLNAIVAETHPPNSSFTMTYQLGSRNGIVVGDQYRSKLQKAGFKIQNYSSIGGTDGGITQYDAVGKKWDVSVVSGKASPRDRATLSVQVRTHGQITSGIGGIGDTTPNSSGSGSATTTTTAGF